MQLIDTHAHIYAQEFDGDRDVVIQKATEERVSKILLPAIDSSTHAAMLETEKQYKNCIAMMGLHPCYVTENYKDELSVVQNYLKQRHFIAVGEIGLDFYWDKTFTQQQYDAFETQIQWALELDLPIVIHSRNAMDETISVIKKYPQLKGIFHCFSGNADQAKQITDAGFLLGIGGVVTYKNGGLDKVIAEVGIDRLVLETDAPYLAPVPFRGKRNETGYLKYIADKVAEVSGKGFEKVAEVTTQNAIKLFKLSE